MMWYMRVLYKWYTVQYSPKYKLLSHTYTPLSNYFRKFVRMWIFRKSFSIFLHHFWYVYCLHLHRMVLCVHNYVPTYKHIYMTKLNFCLFVFFLAGFIFFLAILLLYVAERNFLLFLLPLFCNVVCVCVCVLCFVRELRFSVYEFSVYIGIPIWEKRNKTVAAYKRVLWNVLYVVLFISYFSVYLYEIYCEVYAVV